MGCHRFGVRLLTRLMAFNDNLVHILKQIKEAGEVIVEGSVNPKFLLLSPFDLCLLKHSPMGVNFMEIVSDLVAVASRIPSFGF